MKQKWLYLYWAAIPIYFYGFFFYFAGVGIYHNLRKNTPNSWLPISWFLTLFAYVSWGSLITKFATTTQLQRYLCVVTVPMVLIIASFIGGNRHRIRGKFALLSLLFLLLSSLFVNNLNGIRNEGSYVDRQIRRILGDNLDKIVYTDTRTIKVLQFLYAYKKNALIKNYHELANFQRVENLNDFFVAIDFHRLDLAYRRYGEKPVFDYDNPPQGSTIFATIDNPAPNSGYLQAKILRWIGYFPLIPHFIRKSLIDQTSEFLKPMDGIIFYVKPKS